MVSVAFFSYLPVYLGLWRFGLFIHEFRNDRSTGILAWLSQVSSCRRLAAGRRLRRSFRLKRRNNAAHRQRENEIEGQPFVHGMDSLWVGTGSLLNVASMSTVRRLARPVKSQAGNLIVPS